MKHLLIILFFLLLTSTLFGQSKPKYESVGQCVLQMMTEKKLTGDEMFELVKKECQRILGKVGVKGKKRQKGVLYGRSVNGKWGWYGLGDEEKDSKYVGKTKNGKRHSTRGIKMRFRHCWMTNLYLSDINLVQKCQRKTC